MQQVEIAVLLLLFLISCATSNKNSDLQSGVTGDEKESDSPAVVENYETRYKNAKDIYNSSKDISPNDPAKRIEGLEKADALLVAALKEAEELKLPLKSEIKLLKKDVKKDLTKVTKEKESILKQNQKISLTKNINHENNIRICKKLKEYTDDFEEVKTNCEKSHELFIAAYLERGEKNLKEKKAKEALKAYTTLLKEFPDNNLASEGASCASIIDYSRTGDHLKAFNELEALKAKSADSYCVINYETQIFNDLVKSEQAKAKSFEKSKEFKNLFLAIDSYRYLFNLPKLDVAVKDAIPEKIENVREKIAKIMVKRAEKMASKSKRNLPLVYRELKYAYRFSPVETEKSKQLFDEALNYLNQKREYRTEVKIKSGSKDSSLNSLKDQIVATLISEQSRSPHPSFTAMVEMPNEGKRKPASTSKSSNDLLLTLKLLDYKTEEYGANQPFYMASQYVSGTRQLDNPAWFQAEQEYQSAQAEYNQNYQYYQQMKSNCNNMSNPFAAGMCQGAWSGLSSARLDNARATFNSTPRFIQENIVSDYTYRQYKVGVNLYLRVEEQIENRNNKKKESKIIEYKITRKEGEILEGVQPSDLNNKRDGRYNVPDLNSEKNMAEKSIATEIQNDLIKIADRERGLRFCQKAGKKGIDERAVSDELCRLFTKESDELKEREEYKIYLETEKRLAQYHQISKEDLEKYGKDMAELPSDSASYYLADIN